MGALEINIISISLSLVVGYVVNAIVNGALGFLKDSASMFNKYNLFQIMLPTYLFSTSLLSIIFNWADWFPQIIHAVSLLYFALILFHINSRIIARKRLNHLKDKFRIELLEPWIKQMNLKQPRYSLNFYLVGNNIHGEVILTLLHGEELPEESIVLFRKHLSTKNISLHVRKNPVPRNTNFA